MTLTFQTLLIWSVVLPLDVMCLIDIHICQMLVPLCLLWWCCSLLIIATVVLFLYSGRATDNGQMFGGLLQALLLEDFLGPRFSERLPEAV